MSYLENTPNGKLYIGNVKWGGDFAHAMLFNSQAERDDFMKSNLKLIKENVIEYNPNTFIAIRGKIDDIDAYNYVYYVNDSDIGTSYCCFITNYEYRAPNTTILYIKLDTFQQYIYDTTFYKSLINRAHIKKSDDIIGKWLAREPVGAEAQVYTEISADNFDWTPIYCIHSTSRPIGDGTGTITGFNYGGVYAGDNYSGEYVIPISDLSQGQQYAKWWSKDLSKSITADWTKVNTFLSGTGHSGINLNFNAGEMFDHSNEVMGVYCRPKWCINNMASPTPVNVTKSHSVNGRTVLANGYQPKNNKLFTSLCNVYQIYNNNGFRIIVKPEHLTQNILSITAECNSFDKNGYKIKLNNYNDKSAILYDMPYSATTSIVIDTNTGANRIANVISTSLNASSSVGTLLGGVVSNNPALVISGVESGINTFYSVAESLQAKPLQIGTQGEILGVQAVYQRLHFDQISPSLEECKAIDNYLSVYGYAINEIDDVKKYFNTRANYNYIQCSNVNLRVKAPYQYEQEIKNIMTNGITLWHNYNNFGNYDIDNN